MRTLRRVAPGLLGLLLLLPVMALADTFTEGRHYEVISHGPGTAEPEIVEFFSFGCPHCRTFDPLVKRMLQQKPADIKFRQSHVDFLGGPLGLDLTRGWAVAELLQISEQVKPAMFSAVQDQRVVKDADDVRAVFIAAGVEPEAYDAAISSFMVSGLVSVMQQSSQRFKIDGVPSFVVNGKYKVITRELSSADELNQLLFYLARK